MTKVVLASASPRRKEILNQVGIDCEVMVSQVEEKMDSNNVGDMVEALSSAKAEDVAGYVTGDEFVVVAADTVVVKDGKVYGKPASKDDAAAMLSALQGERHEVYTGVTLISIKDGDGLIDTFHVKTIVDMMPMSDAQIDGYVATGEPMDKAGAYAIQGIGASFVRDVAGDYYNVVGLPIATVLTRLENMGVNLYPSCTTEE